MTPWPTADQVRGWAPDLFSRKPAALIESALLALLSLWLWLDVFLPNTNKSGIEGPMTWWDRQIIHAGIRLPPWWLNAEGWRPAVSVWLIVTLTFAALLGSIANDNAPGYPILAMLLIGAAAQWFGFHRAAWTYLYLLAGLAAVMAIGNQIGLRFHIEALIVDFDDAASVAFKGPLGLVIVLVGWPLFLLVAAWKTATGTRPERSSSYEAFADLERQLREKPVTELTGSDLLLIQALTHCAESDLAHRAAIAHITAVTRREWAAPVDDVNGKRKLTSFRQGGFY